MLSKKGFTLIEVLVVVLIIGVLSSIAIPQYAKALERSRSAEATIAAKALADAQNIYFMAHEEYGNKADLNVEFPALKYFTWGTTAGGSSGQAIGNCKNSSTCSFGLKSRSKNAEIVYTLSDGLVSSAICLGTDCQTVFKVNSGSSLP